MTMDTWPGSMFEPASLHKYLYCEGNPVSSWDPSGFWTVTSIVESVMVMSLITALSYVWVSNITNTLHRFMHPATWEGWVTAVTFGEGAGVGVFIAYFSGMHPEVEPKNGWGHYLILMTGLTIGMPWNSSWSTTTLEGPGYKGANPLTLVGPASWASASLSFGGGGTLTHMTMGMAKTKLSKVPSVIVGWDIGADLMAGLSFPLSLSTWDW